MKTDCAGQPENGAADGVESRDARKPAVHGPVGSGRPALPALSPPLPPFAPYGTAGRSWPRRFWLLLLLGLVSLGALGTAVFVYSNRGVDVHFVNALELSVTVHVGPERIDLGARSRLVRRIQAGVHNVKVLAGTRIIDEHNIRVPKHRGLVVYNVFGAAPLVKERVLYSLSGGVSYPQRETFWGQRLVVCDDIDFVFDSPPEKLAIGSKCEARQWFRQLDHGWSQTVDELMSKDDHRAAELIRRMLLAQPDDGKLINELLPRLELRETCRGATAGRVQEFKLQLRDLSSDIPFHHAFQDEMILKGKRQELRDEYRRRAQQHPDWLAAQYLRARIEPPEESLRLFAELADRHPDDPNIAYGYAKRLFNSRQFAKAETWLIRLSKDPANTDHEVCSMLVRSLIAQGRPEDAVRQLLRYCDAVPRRTGYTARSRTLFGQVALLYPHLVEGKPPQHYLVKWSVSEFVGEASKTEFAIVIGLPVEPADFDTLYPRDRDSAAVRYRARSSLSDALRRIDNRRDMSWLDGATSILLAGECAIEGIPYWIPHFLAGYPPELHTFITEGRDSPELADLDLELQAAMSLVKAMRARAAGQPYAHFVEQARSDDLLRSMVTIVADSQFKPDAVKIPPVAVSRPKPADAATPANALKRLNDGLVRIDVVTFTGAFAPECQPVMKALFLEVRPALESIRATKATVAAKLGEQTVETLFRNAGFVQRLVPGTITDGEIDWKEVEVAENGDTARILLRRNIALACKRINERWYLDLPGISPEELLETVAQSGELAARLADALEKFEQAVKAGEITRDNAHDRFDKMVR